MRTMHKAAAAAVGLVLAGTGLTAGASSAFADEGEPAARAQKPTVGCDDYSGDWFWGKIKSVRQDGRVATLYSEKKDDDEAYTAGTGNLKRGDTISVERSKKTFPMFKTRTWNPSDADAKSEGYKSCRNTIDRAEAAEDAADTRSVWHQNAEGSYAVRACVHPRKGETRCTKWYVDHSD